MSARPAPMDQARFRSLKNGLRCKGCAYFKTPGRADGYCANELRADLPPAYGANHPLRRLPANGGRDCTVFEEASYR